MEEHGDRDAVKTIFASLTEDGALKALVAQLPAVIYIELPGGPADDVYVSPQIESMLGYTPEEWLELEAIGWLSIIHPDDRERVHEAAQHAADTGERYSIEYRALHKDGHSVWIAEDDVCIFGEDGEQLYWQGVMLDITPMKEAEEQLRLSESQFQGLVEHMPAIFYVDPPDIDAPTRYVSPQIKEILGVTPEVYIAEPHYWREHLHPDDRMRAETELEQFAQTGSPESSVYRMIRDDGEIVWIHDRAMVIRDDEGDPILTQGVMFDITEQKEAEEQISFLAHHDRLTGLPNRAMFEEMLELSMARARRSDAGLAVLLLDLDNFKLVNDSLGHAAGDELLSQLAERLQDPVTHLDFVARQGGDEFLILLADIPGDPSLPGPDMDAALIAAESAVSRIELALRHPFAVGDTEAFTTASIGISFFPGSASDAHALLKQADTAMYRSKQTGPGGYSIYSTESADPSTRLSFSTRLRKAVESQNWVLHYQPIVDLTEAKMVGVEGLIRWQDPNAGLIPPGEFIPLAEEMGLIEAIGEWVIEEACRQAAAWKAAGVDLQVSFNLSPRQLWQPELADKIFANLDAVSIEPSRLVLEITEGTAMTDPERTQRILWDLHGRGLHLAIDDFGTGYSSLSRLKHLPVSTLKIDRAFVMDLPADNDAGSMANAVIQLAHSLGMSPLAEGIETEEQWKFLLERGCHLGQGYFFSRPVPADEITAFAQGGPLKMTDDVTA